MPTKTIERKNLLNATPGVESFLTVVRYGQRGAYPKVYLQAGLHADEWPGVLALNHLQALLDAADKKGLIQGEIILLPYANPNGMAQFVKGYHVGRFDFDMTGNFNRDFPDLAQLAAEHVAPKLTDDIAHNQKIIRQQFIQILETYQPQLATEHLKKTLLQLSCDCDYVLDLHCDTRSVIHLYCNECQRTQGEQLAQDLDCDLVLLEEDPGCIGFDIANAGAWWKLQSLLDAQGIDKPIGTPCFSSTIELRGQADVANHLNYRDAQGLYDYLVTIGAVNSAKYYQSTASESNAMMCCLLTAVDTITAPSAGLVVFTKALGSFVQRGDVVAELIDITQSPSDASRVPLTTATDGIVFTQIAEQLVRPGHTVVKVAGREPLDYRQGNLLAF